MPGTSRWRTLDLANGAPKILLKANFTSSGYSVQLTDLCRVWSESFSKRDIIRRALDDNPSIDPSEDDEQFRIFLGKIESAINGEDDTNLELSASGDSAIDMRLSAPLPKPLPTLVWTLRLRKQDEGVLGNVLTMPLLHQASDLQSQIRSLISELHEKDRVISKITDRLETSGNDLTTVFPGVSNVKTNKKKSQREQLARHVRSLSDFDEGAWRQRLSHGEDTDVWAGVDEVMRDLPGPESTGTIQMMHGEWWHGFSGSTSVKQESQRSILNAGISTESTEGREASKEDSMVDDGFQRQTTPDHLKRKVSIQSDATEGDEQVPPLTEVRNAEPVQQNDGDSTTEDEEDLDAPLKSKPAALPKSSSPPSNFSTASPGPSKKLGAIGGRSSRPPPSPAKCPMPEPQPQPQKAARSKLGVLGGKTKVSEETTTTSDGDRTASSSPPAPRKMGIIGGKRKPSSATPSTATSPRAEDALNERSRAPAKDPNPPPRETSQERADRKRDALKKELEQKAKAPAKKKRRF